jgi:hypothetical protein
MASFIQKLKKDGVNQKNGRLSISCDHNQTGRFQAGCIRAQIQ